LGPSWERGRPKGIMGLLYMASNGLILRGILVKPRPLRGLKGGVWSNLDEVQLLIWSEFHLGLAWLYQPYQRTRADKECETSKESEELMQYFG